MADNDPTRGTQQTQSLRVAMFLDSQGVYLNQKQAELLRAVAQSKGRVEPPKFYYNSQHKNQVNDQIRLEKLGFQGVDVPD